MTRLSTKFILGLMGMLLLSASLMAQFPKIPDSESPKTEFRSIWVATALGLDWPKTTNVAEQQATLLAIIERHVEMKMNAVVFQATARGDAHYSSERLPWAIRLTGTMGQDPGWDPLQFVIDESKKRGLEVHAWYNVFNVGNESELNAYAVASNPKHITQANPEWLQTFGNSIWMNAGIPVARQWAIDNVMEIVENYDVDAIHFDFARYPSMDGFTGDFNTRATYDPDLTSMSLADWRRHNVNRFQREVYAAIREVKPWVKVGTSPFGQYQSTTWPQPHSENCPYFSTGGPCSWAGATSYSQQYQDAVAWINEGVNDYIAPQLYWAIGPPGPHFEFLVQDWRRLSITSGKHVYIGLGPYKDASAPDNNNVLAELGIQIDSVRVNGHAGHMHFRYDSVFGPSGPPTSRNVVKVNYKALALVPTMDWMDTDAPDPVNIQVEAPAIASTQSNSVTLTWEASDFTTASGDTKVSYAIYRVKDFQMPDPTMAMEDPANLLALTGNTSYTDSPANTDGENYYYFVTPYSRNWVEGQPSNVVEYLTPTSIDSGDMIANRFELEQNYPNPFNPTTQIRFAIGESLHTSLVVYDAVGRQVTTLVNGVMPAGIHSVTFDAGNLSSGLYIYVLRAGDQSKTQKMMLLK